MEKPVHSYIHEFQHLHVHVLFLFFCFFRQRMQEPPLKKLKAVTSQPAALCVAVNGDYVAVGYHADGIKLFSLRSGVL